MRYTRYNYKKKKNNEIGKFILSFVVMGGLAIVVGIVMANVLSKVLPDNDSNPVAQVDNGGTGIADASNSGEATTSDSKDGTVATSVNSSFASVQCGYYSSEENAKVAMDDLGSAYAPFIVQDGEKYRVMTGVYGLEEAGTVIEQLKGKGIQSIRVTFQLDSKDEGQNQIAAICQGYLEILNTALKNDVEKVETEDFKNWLATLDNVEGNEQLTNLKTYINGIPAEIKKENVSEQMSELYKIMSIYKVK